MNYPTTLAVDVTEADIRNGKRGACLECAVSLAIRRHFPDKAVSVSHGGAIVIRNTTEEDYEAGYDFPKDVAPKISRFDAGLPVDPFSFVATLETLG